MKRLICAMSIVAAILALASCDANTIYNPDTEFIFRVENNSDNPVVMFVPEHGNIQCEYVTGELPEEMTDKLRKTFLKLDAHGFVNFFYTYDNSEVVSPISGYHPNDKVSFYFFDQRVLEQNEWSAIVSGKMWLARYSYSPDDVISMGKVISYPEIRE